MSSTIMKLPVNLLQVVGADRYVRSLVCWLSVSAPSKTSVSNSVEESLNDDWINRRQHSLSQTDNRKEVCRKLNLESELWLAPMLNSGGGEIICALNQVSKGTRTICPIQISLSSGEDALAYCPLSPFHIHHCAKLERLKFADPKRARATGLQGHPRHDA
jgi:hypothetical protein